MSKETPPGRLDELRLELRRRAMRSAAAAFRAAGLVVTRRAKHPKTTFLGLANHPFRTVLDIGANEGQFAMSARPAFPKAHFVCVEPQPAPRAHLEAWARRDGRTTVLPVALGAAPGRLLLNVHQDHNSSSSLLPSTRAALEADPGLVRQKQVAVEVMRLDDAVATVPEIRDDLLLKMDVQGYEEQVLLGAPKTLARAHAVLLEVCLDPFYEGQATFDGLYRLLTTAGLEYRGNMDQVLSEDGRVSFLDAVFVRKPLQC